MANFLKNLFKRKAPEPQPEVAPVTETVRDNLFSTGSYSSKAKKQMSLLMRQQQAFARTFTAGVEMLKPVDANGAAIDYAMDEAYPDLTTAKIQNSRGGYMPIEQLEWYGNQGFIGWQIAGMLSQNWLIDKACGVPAQDAVRKGYTITLNNGETLDPKIIAAMTRADKRMKIPEQVKGFIKKGRIFGIRHALFLIDGIDYELPFNPDGIRPNSYKGITQIDPYWIAPMLDYSAAADPASPDFYEPTWWLVKGKKVHKSHFIIMRNGDDVVDILKPAYLYGGIGIPQKIYERVYAAERTANESPMLLLSKRMTVLKTDTTKWFGPDAAAPQQIEEWAQFQNNFGIKVLGSEDEVQQFDTALSELNDTILTQYQLVASACNVPVTKLMGTSPKGMNATGEYDEASYHEELESIQAEIATPFIERHHLCLMRSHIAPKFGISPLDTEIVWNPLDSYTTKEQAEINKLKADTYNVLSAAGAVDGFDIRSALIADKNSGFNGIDPIVPNGVGDREHEQEMAEALLGESEPAPKPESESEPVKSAQDSAEPENEAITQLTAETQQIKTELQALKEDKTHALDVEDKKITSNENIEYAKIENEKADLLIKARMVDLEAQKIAAEVLRSNDKPIDNEKQAILDGLTAVVDGIDELKNTLSQPVKRPPIKIIRDKDGKVIGAE